LLETGLAGFLKQAFDIDRPEDFFQIARAKLTSGLIQPHEIAALIGLALLAIHGSGLRAENLLGGQAKGEKDCVAGSPVYRAAQR
jgi:hypothetical protein